ncbi:MAG: hypothetical protein JKY71_08040 [Alphaproteobacteria bacterium]|nr:hypothetical protein [Alphaproteobacteria bacterium]
MTQIVPTHTSRHATEDQTILPLPPQKEQEAELEIYARFMRHLRHVPNSRTEIKVLSAIQFTADMLDYSDAHIAKALVEMGLRAPRMAFPADYLKFADRALMRNGWDIGGPSAAMFDLKSFWDRIGEDRFAAFKGDFPLVAEDAYV